MGLSRWILAAALVLGTAVMGPGVNVAEACPSCKTANETDNRLPRAYMFSILFMLAVPATIFGSMGYGLYRISRREEEAIDSEAPFLRDER